MDAWKRDKGFKARLSGGWDTVFHGKQVIDVDAAVEAAVAKLGADRDAAAREVLAELAREVGLQVNKDLEHSNVDLRARIRELITARDGQIGELCRVELAPRLERIRDAASKSDLEEVRYQISQLDQTIAGLVRTLGAKWP